MQVLLWLTLAATLLPACRAENCGGGVDGLLNDAQTACCPKSCKKCATKGCANRKGGSKRCCPNRVAKQPRCSKKNSPAPCRPALFNIVLVPVPGTDPKYTKYFTQAKERWESIITHDLVGYESAPPGGWFLNSLRKQLVYTEPVDDLVIAYSVEKIDGEGNILGMAGPLVGRNDPISRKRGEAKLPLSGSMQFDIADAARLVKADVFQYVVLHEMGHVLGIGSLWPTRKSNCGFYTRGKKKGQPPTCSTYTAKADGTCSAQVEFSKLDLGRGKRLKMETKGSQGTACAHWSEDQLCNELMTGRLDSYKRKPPLSKITIAALKDLGYKVDYSQADKFTLRCPQRAALRDMYALTGEPYGVMLPTTPIVFSDALNATATLVDETWW